MHVSIKRLGVVALVLALLGAGAASLVFANTAGDAVQGQAASGAPEDQGADEQPANENPSDDGAVLDDTERMELLARWDALIQERQRLRAELRQVERELLQVARELWPHEWARTRGRMLDGLERFEERMGEYGDEVSAWIPPAVIDHIAKRTGKTADEVRELIKSGQWRELWAIMRSDD